MAPEVIQNPPAVPRPIDRGSCPRPRHVGRLVLAVVLLGAFSLARPAVGAPPSLRRILHRELADRFRGATACAGAHGGGVEHRYTRDRGCVPSRAVRSL